MKDRLTTLQTISYKELKKAEIDVALFSSFNRYQDVKKCWRKENGEWILKEINFTEQWGADEYEYLPLSCIHCSYENRGSGIGKKMFFFACKKAKDMGAQKLYISAHSSQESQAFYKAMGCVEAVEYNTKLVAKEPCDCQLEYNLMYEE